MVPLYRWCLVWYSWCYSKSSVSYWCTMPDILHSFEELCVLTLTNLHNCSTPVFVNFSHMCELTVTLVFRQCSFITTCQVPFITHYYSYIHKHHSCVRARVCVCVRALLFPTVCKSTTESTPKACVLTLRKIQPFSLPPSLSSLSVCVVGCSSQEKGLSCRKLKL